MAGLLCTVNRDLTADTIVITVAGQLGTTTVPSMRTTLLKCVSECPGAIIVDLSRCVYTSPTLLTVFLAAAQLVRPQPAVAILLVGPGTELHGPRERAALGSVTSYPDVPAALAAASTARTLFRRDVHPYSSTGEAPGLAREVVRSICDQWGIPHLGTAAELIVSELVTNAVVHAGTDIEVDLSLRSDYLHIRVRDESSVQPVRYRPAPPGEPVAGGRGLNLVQLFSTAWGYVVGGSGKVVWATLRARPIGSTRHLTRWVPPVADESDGST